MVLAPDVRAEQVVERRDRPPPRDVARDLQPLRVLVEHRVDDVDERLVAVEEPVPAGEQVALEPALAQVLGEHLHHAAVRRQVARRRAAVSRLPGASGRPRTRRRAGSTRSRRGRRAGSCRGFARDHVAQEAAEHARRLADARARAARRRRRSRGSRAARGRAAARRRSRAGSRSSAARPAGASARELGHERAALVEQLLGPVAAQPLLELAQVLRVVAHVRRAAPGASATCPRPAARRPPSGPVQPFGVRRTIIGQRGRSVGRPGARLAGSRRSRRAPSSSAAASRRCTASGSSPVDEAAGR